MKNALSFKRLRSRPFRAVVSPFILASFLLSVLIYCMCGPFCGTAGSDQQIVAMEKGCCSSHAPQPETSGCCNHAPGQTHCEDDVSDRALQLSDSEIPIYAPTAVVYFGELFLPQQNPGVHNTVRPLFSASGPPTYLRFQSFLI